MAKPIFLSPADIPVASTSQIHIHPPRPPRKRTRRRHISSPSSALLAALATISAASSTADGHPLDAHAPPPDFLCPQFSADCRPDQLPSLTTHPQARRDVTTASPSTKVKRGTTRPFVPPKYVQGDDGRWRKNGSWSLYGSISCPNAQCSPEDTSVPIVDDQIQPTQATTTALQPTVDADMSSQLPPGWPAESSEDTTLNAIILTLSLVLAVLICIFMIGCIAWRRKRRAQARAEQDPEQKHRGPPYDDDSDDESEDFKRMRSQQRMWSKATARWRANVRLSARRRRVQRSISTREGISATASASMASLHTLSSSTSVSRRNLTTVSGPRAESSSHVDELQSIADVSRPSSPDVTARQLTQPLPSTQPPAYHTDSGCSSQEGNVQLSESSDGSGARPPVTHVATSDEDDREHPLYLPSTDAAAHVATDDKVLLARMAALASAPPTELSSGSRQAVSGAPSGTVYPAVPALDEFEDMDLPGPESDRPSSQSSPMAQTPAPSYSHDPSSSPFPLPPAKSRLAAPLFYEYPSSFEEDVMGSDPPSEPSAPPFEAAAAIPSAPPLDFDRIHNDASVIPSAPPLAEDNDVEPVVLSDVIVARASARSGEDVPGPNAPSLGSLTPSSPSRAHAPTPGRRPPDYLP